MSLVCVVKRAIGEYPDKKALFRPSVEYPEYLFRGDISKEENPVYDMVREGLAMLGLDAENIGQPCWNPFGGTVEPGNTVLIKPNLVLHENKSGGGVDCLYTNPSLVAAVVDYVCIALKGRGKIVIGDAPLQECDFKTLINQAGYEILIDFYRKKGIEIELADFRNIKTYEKGGLHYLQEEQGSQGIVVNLGENSAFADVSPERMRNLRITNYDPRILQRHHHGKTHEYNISKYVLDADVIINMPKPKTHRKAGVTISLKNLVGINANKEFLPHHTAGSKAEGGDAYLHTSSLLEMANQTLDIKNELVQEGEFVLASQAEAFYNNLMAAGRERVDELFWEGSWYGNDTIWRTILDLNRILLYADKNGTVMDTRQRKIFIVGDMIVSGEKEGPLEPSPVYPGAIVLGDDPLKFDQAVCSLMGFDFRDIPTLNNTELVKPDHPISDFSEPEIISNEVLWDRKSLDEIREHASLKFQPSFGWLPKLGSRYRDDLYRRIRENGNTVCIFGAGLNGVYAAKELQSQGIQVAAFCDNNPELWGKEILGSIRCIQLGDAVKDMPFIIAARDQAAVEIQKQIEAVSGRVFGIINK